MFVNSFDRIKLKVYTLYIIYKKIEKSFKKLFTTYKKYAIIIVPRGALVNPKERRSHVGA